MSHMTVQQQKLASSKMPHLLLSLEGICKRCAPLLARGFDRGRQPRDLSLLILCMYHQTSLAP